MENLIICCFLRNIHKFSIRHGKKLLIPASDITKMILTLPDGPIECDDESKVDFETLMVDPLMGDVYLIQKNIFMTDVNIYKVNITQNNPNR
jgi:hypothetical protein